MSDFFEQLDSELGTIPDASSGAQIPHPKQPAKPLPPLSKAPQPQRPIPAAVAQQKFVPHTVGTPTPSALKKPVFAAKAPSPTPTHQEGSRLPGRILGKVVGGFTKNSPTKRLQLPPANPPQNTEVSQHPHPLVQNKPTLSPATLKGLNVPVLFPKSHEPQTLPKLERNITRIIPIGGLRTIGANMTMIEHNDEILLVDGGLEFARGGESPGFDYLLPDIRCLLGETKKIKGMLVTHGHLDHIGALKNIIPALGFPPIYAAPFTIAFIKKFFEEAGLRGKVQFFPINPDSGKLSNIGVFKYEFFRVNHTIPDSCGIYIETPNVRMMHMGDYKIEFFPRLDRPADLQNYARIAARGIDILFQETTNSYKQEWTASETNVSTELRALIQDAPERVIIGNFSTLISRIQDIVSIAESLGKFVLINGRSMVDSVAIARELGYLKCKEGVMKPLDEKTMESIPENKQIIITTGAQGEEFGGLNNISKGDHRSISIKPRDTIILSSSIIPGNELAIIGMMNRLNRFGAKIITIKEFEVHSGGHGGIVEQRVLINLVKPKYIIPVHGDITQRLTLKREAVKMGWDPKNVPMLEDGSIVELDSRHEIIFGRKKIPMEQIGVDGMSIGALSSRAIQDRIQIGEEGVLIVNSKDGVVESRGLFFPDEITASHTAISAEVKKLTSSKKIGDNDKNARDGLAKELGKMLNKVWGRSPVIVVL